MIKQGIDGNAFKLNSYIMYLLHEQFFLTKHSIKIQLYDQTVNAKIEHTPTWKYLHMKNQRKN